MHVFPRISQKTAKDLADYWDHNWDLAQELQTYWGDSGPASMDSVFPVRLYGERFWVVNHDLSGPAALPDVENSFCVSWIRFDNGFH